MSMIRTALFRTAGVALVTLCLASCDSSGVQTSASVSVGVGYGSYYGPGFYDPYYYGGGCCRGAVVVRPPVHARPPVNRPVNRPSTRPMPLPAGARPRRR